MDLKTHVSGGGVDRYVLITRWSYLLEKRFRDIGSDGEAMIGELENLWVM